MYVCVCIIIKKKKILSYIVFPLMKRLSHRISRSENVVVNKPNQGPAVNMQTVSMYHTEDLICEGSELCFEEVRARRYFVRCKQVEKQREFGRIIWLSNAALLHPIPLTD